jgi:peptide-N4-(N-acetyl-beta-glucosaminyl)asparagine amidase
MTMSCVLALEENPEDVYLETTSVLLKLVENVIKNPSNPKYRNIRLGNSTVANKLLPAVGAMECLFEMGFEEVSTRRDKILGCDFFSFCFSYMIY